MSKEITTLGEGTLPIIAGRMAGEERRLQILRVAVRLFSQRGFRGTTTKEIAGAAGVSDKVWATVGGVVVARASELRCRAVVKRIDQAAGDARAPVLAQPQLVQPPEVARRDEREWADRVELCRASRKGLGDR